MQTWYSTSFQRPQQMARALAECGVHVVYCEPWQADHFARKGSEADRAFVGIKDIGDRLHLLRWPTVGLRDLFARVDRGALLMYWPWQTDFIPEDSASPVIYEVVDDQELICDNVEEMRRRYVEWVNKADVVVTSADDLVSQLRPHREDVLLLPNGVRLEDWQRRGEARVPADMVAARRSERVVAYYGAIAEWFDWSMWLHAAKARPKWSFVMIGASWANDPIGIQKRAAEAPNMHYLGPKPYAELAEYMRHVDVATIPFVLNSITHSCSPVKLFEYMAAGKPVVATAMREVLKYETVVVARSNEDFVRCLDLAVAKRSDPAYLASLEEEARRNTWESRARSLIAALRQANEQYGPRPRRAALEENSLKVSGAAASLSKS